MSLIGSRVVLGLAVVGATGACGSPGSAALFDRDSPGVRTSDGAGGATGGSSNTTGGTSTGGTTSSGCMRLTGTMQEIDTFEDRDGEIAALEGRRGTWGIWNDGTSWQQPSTALPSFIPV